VDNPLEPSGSIVTIDNRKSATRFSFMRVSPRAKEETVIDFVLGAVVIRASGFAVSRKIDVAKRACCSIQKDREALLRAVGVGNVS
jgi:hypothetical protein